MRFRLLLIALLANSSHAQTQNSDNAHRVTALKEGLARLTIDSRLFAPTPCRRASSYSYSANCAARTMDNSLSTPKPSGELVSIQTVNWSMLNYPALSSGAWALIPDVGYQMLRDKTTEPSRQTIAKANSADARLWSIPLATLVWFFLGCTLGWLALLRRTQKKSTIQIS